MHRTLPVLVLLQFLIGPHIGAAGKSKAAPPLNQGQKHETRRHLILCLDGVGFSTIERMVQQGRFRSFKPPARLIAPFPTLTNPGLIEILGPLGAPEARGYEDYYFDPVANRMRGGFFARFSRKTFIEGTYRQLFDFHPSPIAMTLEYAAPPISPWIDAHLTLLKIRREFEKSTEPTFIAYLASTDPLAHVSGQWLQRNFLETLDRTCQAILRRFKDEVDISLFSDHGNHFTRYRKVDLEPEIKRLGFRFDDRVKDERSIVQPHYGLVGCAVLYTHDANKQTVAVAAARTKGVDLAAYSENETVYIVSKSGRARIERINGRYRYTADMGDPLQLDPIMTRLRNEGRVREDGSIADADLFEATSDHIYPDAIRRLWEGVTNHVEYPAGVLVSFQDGYYDGSVVLDTLAVLRATHGNLRRWQTAGILMTTKRELPEAVRAADVWSVLGQGPRSTEITSHKAH